MASASFGLEAVNRPALEECSPSFDVIAIHGLYGSKDSSWEDIKWKDDILPTLPSQTRLSLYTYDVFGWDGGVLTRDGARHEANKLLDSLLELRSKDREKVAIVFIGHDIGGTLIKEAIALSQQGTYKDIYESTRLLIYLGCPHRGSKVDLQAGCAELLMSHQGVTFPEASQFAGSLATWILDVNNSFAETRMLGLTSIINTGSCHADPRHRIFNGFITSMAMPMAYMLPPPKPHVTHRDLLKHSTLTVLGGYVKYHKAPFDSSVLAQLTHFLRNTPPQHPLETPRLVRDTARWSSAHQNFQGWMDAKDNLQLVYAPDDTAIDAAEHLYNLVESLRGDGPVLRFVEMFVFDPNDCRYDSAEAMLCTMLAQLCKKKLSNEGREMVENAVEYLGICRNLHPDDIYSVLIDLFFQRLAYARGKGQRPIVTTLIIGNLDARVQNAAFLFRMIEETVFDCDLKLKVIITSSDPASLSSNHRFVTTESALWQEGTAQQSTIGGTLNVSSGWVQGPAVVTKEVLALVQSQPQLHDHASALHQIRTGCGGDSKLWKVIANFLGRVQHPNNLQDPGSFLNQLIAPGTLTPNKVFDLMLRSTPPQARSRSILLLERVAFVFRPLSLSEVLDLESFDSSLPPEAPTNAEDFALCGGGLLTIKRHEVRFAHSALRDYLLMSEDDVLTGWLPLGPKASSIHKAIAESCLRYITGPGKRQRMQDRTDRDSPTRWHTPFEHRDDFLSYAAKYWLRHAMYAAKNGHSVFDTEACVRFLDDEETVGLWASLYLSMSPALTGREQEPEQGPRRYKDQLASLVIFAEHEAQELLESAVNKHRGLQTKGFGSACCDALIVAAGKGNLTMVMELMSVSQLDENDALDLTILAAIEGGDSEVFDWILDVARKTPEMIQDWTRLLARAASLDRRTEAKKLLALAETARTSGPRPKMESPPLIYGYQRRFSEIHSFLREAGLEVSRYLPTAIKSAVKFGRLGDLATLLSSLSEDPREESTVACYHGVFSDSNYYGRRKPVQLALDDMKRKLAQINATNAKECQGAGELLDYILGMADPGVPSKQYNGPGYANAVGSAIERWPRAVDLLDLLTCPNDRVNEDDFASTWALWMDQAVKGGNFDTVKLVFENGEKSRFATTKVKHLTATRGLRSAMEQLNNGNFCLPYLIEKGADIITRHLNGRTPLYQAAYKDLVGTVKILIGNKVDVNAQGDESWYPIHACYDNAPITRMLVEAGADLNVPTSDKEQFPPLYFSVKWGEEDVVDELLKRPLNRESLKAGLAIAIDEKQIQLAEKLLKYCPDNSYLPNIDDILHRQVQGGNLKLLEMLLSYQYRLDPERRDEYDRTPLHCISRDTPVEVIKALVLRGAKVEATSALKGTPLTTAAVSGNVAAVRYLVEECGALVNTPGGLFYGGPLHAACHHGTLEMVQILLSSKTDSADINQVTPGIMGTPLQAALLRNQDSENKAAIVRYLVLEAKADVNLATAFWGGALFLACLTSGTDTVRLLLDDGGARIEVSDHVGRTPLHFALYRTREHVELLLDKGADLAAVDVTRRNAMHFAVLSGRLDVVESVMRKWGQYVEEKRPGFENKTLSEFVDREDDHGWTPLLWALRAPSNWGSPAREIKEIVQALLEHGARRLVRGRGIDRTWTPMKLAKYYSLGDDIVSLLKPTHGDFINMSPADREWGWENTDTKRGVADEDLGAFCDHCLLGFHGLYYPCVGSGCENAATCFCYSCYQSSDKLHDKSHEFEVRSELEFDDGPKPGYISGAEHVESGEEGSGDNDGIGLETDAEASEGDGESDNTSSS